MPDMSKRLFAVLQVRDTEIRMAVWVAALFACIQAELGIAGNTADALFFLRFGVDYLPYLFLALGAATLLVSLAYAAGLGRLAEERYFRSLLLLAALLLLAERVSIWLDRAALYPVLWLTVNLINSVLGILLWNVAGQVCDARQAKRLFSLFASAGILGGVVGNALTGRLALWLRTENLLFVCAAILLLGLLIMRRIGPLFGPPPKREQGSGLLKDVRIGFEVTRSSPLMQLVAISSILFSVLFFSMSFPFSKVVSSSLRTEAEVAGFLGLFSSLATTVTFLTSLLIANRLYVRVGVVNAILLLPVTYLLGFVVWAIHFDLTTAVVARLAQMVALGGIAGAAWNAFFNVIPPERRGQMQAFESGVPAQLGVMLSGVLLILGERVLNTTQIFVMGTVAAVTCGYLVWRMRHEYGAALLAALRAGLLDVFAGVGGLQKLAAEANARQATWLALADPKPTVRRTAVEILASMDAPEAIEPALRLLQDPEPEVRGAVLDALARLKTTVAADRIAASLADPDPSVRTAGVRALSVLDPSPVAKLVPMLQDPDAGVRAQAAAVLSHSGEREQACRVLVAMLRSPVPAERMQALQTIAECKPGIAAAQILPLLDDASCSVRLSAVQALGAIREERACHSLLRLLEDPDGDIRHAAAVSLRSHPDITEQVIEILRIGTERGQRAALEALEGNRSGARAAVANWAVSQIPRASQLRSWALALGPPQESRALSFLKELLREHEWKTEEGILRALALLGTAEATRLIAQGLKAQDQETRAQAVEALDTLADKRIARGLVAFLEEPDSKPTQDPHTVLKTLSTHPDTWLRALAVHARSEMLWGDWQDLTAQIRSDPDPLVQSAVSVRFALDGEAMPETTKTLSTVDRVLFLRGVPIFSSLGPEELKSIADLATERLFPPNEYLCREGEIGRELFVIVEGQVRVVKGTDGNTRTLRTLGVGEQIGELAILCEGPRSATVLAEGSGVRTLVLTGDALQAILRDRPEVSRAMLASLARRLSTL